MLEAQQVTEKVKKSRKVHEVRDPEADFEAARYKIDEKTDGFPAVAFKAACAIAARDVFDIKRGLIFQSFHIINGVSQPNGQDLIPIKYESVHNREDMVRVGMGVADLRYRPQYLNWSCVLRIRYMATMIDVGTILELFRSAGFAVGVGEMRPGKGYSNGQFEIDYSSVKELVAA